MRIFSGIQPSGVVHIGNYLGAMKNWAKIQENSPAGENDCIYCIVDYHAITVDYPPKEMPQRIIDAAKDVIAVGVSPEKSTIFLQSDIKEHTELAWILNTITSMGELNRMTQYKEKSKQKALEEEIKGILLRTDWKSLKDPSESAERLYRVYLEAKENIDAKTGVGLFDYPILMAADILIYKAEGVPVGEDQVQHVELARDLARRFNKKFGKTFPEPKVLVTEAKRIMSLTGEGKMSKSDAPHTYIALTDSPDVIRQKIGAATTDDGKQAEISSGTKNLLFLLEQFAGKDIAAKYFKERLAGTIKYSKMKPELAEAIIKELKPFQKKRAEISDEEVKRIFKEGADRLQPMATKTINEVKEKMGLII